MGIYGKLAEQLMLQYLFRIRPGTLLTLEILKFGEWIDANETIKKFSQTHIPKFTEDKKSKLQSSIRLKILKNN